MLKCRDCVIFNNCSEEPNKDDEICDEFDPRKDGLTCEEGIVMDYIVSAWNEFTKLERQHPNELSDFADAIHQLQSILGLRVLRKDYPHGWIIK